MRGESANYRKIPFAVQTVMTSFRRLSRTKGSSAHASMGSRRLGVRFISNSSVNIFTVGSNTVVSSVSGTGLICGESDND